MMHGAYNVKSMKKVIRQQLTASQLSSYGIIEHEGSLPCSQQPAIGPYPEPDESSPHHAIPLLENNCSIILPYKPSSSQWPLSIRFTHQNYVCISLLRHAYHIPPTHHPWYDAANVRLEVHIIRIFIVQFSPVSCQFLLLWPPTSTSAPSSLMPLHYVLPFDQCFWTFLCSWPPLTLILRICAATTFIDAFTLFPHC